MANQPKKPTPKQGEPQNQDADRRESGMPGGGEGRTDQPGRTGVWPGSGPYPPGDVPVVEPGSFGQGERGPEGYSDSGTWSPETTQEILREQQERDRQEKEKGGGKDQH